MITNDRGWVVVGSTNDHSNQICWCVKWCGGNLEDAEKLVTKLTKVYMSVVKVVRDNAGNETYSIPRAWKHPLDPNFEQALLALTTWSIENMARRDYERLVSL